VSFYKDCLLGSVFKELEEGIGKYDFSKYASDVTFKTRLDERLELTFTLVNILATAAS